MALERSGLFFGIDACDIDALLKCSRARRLEFGDGETIIWEGDDVADIGVVISGSARSVMSDTKGNSTIITHIESGGFIGIFLAAGHRRSSPVSVIAKTRVSAVFIPFAAIMDKCTDNCARHDKLIRNCLSCIAEKSLLLHDRIDCLIRQSVRDKISAFLNQQSRLNNSSVFTIPFDRSDMAAYINVDRSALSRELSRMKNEGILDYYKNSFKLLNIAKQTL